MKKSFIKLALVLLISALTISLAGCTLLQQFIGAPDTGDEHTHEYAEEITNAPTCAEDGVKTFTCSCGDSYTEALEKLPHTKETLPAVAPTCTEKGLTEGEKCSVCNEVLVAQEDVAELGHDYEGVVTTAPTCEDKGVMTYTCKNDSTHTYTEEIDELGHADIAPKDHVCDNGCGTSQGTHNEQADSHVCEYCGAVAGECRDGDDNDHNCDVCDAKLSDCAAAEGSHNCAVCGTKLSDCAAAEGSHNCAVCGTKLSDCATAEGSHNCAVCGTKLSDCAAAEGSHDCAVCGTKLSECTAAEGSHNCAVCDAKLSDCAAAEGSHNCAVCGTKISDCAAAEGSHNCAVCGTKLSDCKAGAPVVENSTSATCGEAGSYDEVIYCSVCGDELNRTTHSVDALPHSYQENVTKAPTCEAAGSKTLTCSACGDEKTEEIAALGHNEISYEAKAPTCTAIGWDAYVKCTRCDYSTYNELAATSHNYDEKVTAPDCLKGGYTTFTCLGCGKTYTGNETAPVGHKETALVTTPDCLNGGYTTYTCTVCGNTRTGDETEALGHTEETVAGKPATCTENGITDGKKCSVCQVTLEEQVEILASGHDYDSVVTIAPTCTAEGLMTYTCNNCSDSYTVVMTTSGHSYDDEFDFVCNNCGFDTAAFRLQNGDFENGLEGWTVVGNIGSVSSEKTYWTEAIEFGMDGEKMFSAYAPGALESAVGTLTSSNFVIGGSGFVTFKVGGMRDANYVYVDVVDAETKEILARYYNGLWSDADLGGCKLVAYKADLSAFMGKEVFFRLSDNADSGYGLFFADSFVTYYENEPEGFNYATAVDYTVSGTIYDVFNGSFELGDVQGWWNIGEIGLVTNANGYWGDNIPYEKVGDFLFTGVESFGADTMREGNRGYLTSSAFEIGGTGFISFKLGGGGNALCYVQVIDAVTGEVLARYHQQAQRDAILIQYVADLSAYVGRTARIQVIDQAENGWGCVSFDHVVTYYPEGAALPEGILANDIKGDIKYTIENGSFETGNIDGWTMNITEAGAHNTIGWVLENEIDAGWYTKNDGIKDGRFLFTFAQPGDINCENTKGTLQSSTFTLKQGAFVSFKFGAAGGAQNHDVYIELCRVDGSVIARFYNDAPGKMNTQMNAYFYQYQGGDVECFFRVVDNSTGDYGCVVVDDFRVNLESAPEGYIAAIQ